jgi:hypothetical protein
MRDKYIKLVGACSSIAYDSVPGVRKQEVREAMEINLAGVLLRYCLEHDVAPEQLEKKNG